MSAGCFLHLTVQTHREPLIRPLAALAALTFAAAACTAPRLSAQQPGHPPADAPHGPAELIHAMAARENDNAAHQDRYEFLSNDRSDRTGGHLWTERVVEIAAGRVRLLLAVDGQTLSPARQQQERLRLDAIVRDPAAFERQEAAQKSDEAGARKMLDLLGKAFLFDNVRLDETPNGEGTWHIDFHPNPAFSASGIEDRILASMSGTVVIDRRQLRLMHVDGTLPGDVSLGFGLLATIHAGSHFASDRRDLGGHWRTIHVLTDIRGKAAFFKTLSRNSELTRSEFQYLDANTTLPQAVARLEDPH